MSRRLTTEQFISKAIVKHKIVFDYSKTIYIKANEPVIISCYQHGEFKQTPYNHLNSKLGCPKCSYKNTGEILKVSQNELIKRFVDKHGDKYDYVNCKYNHMHEKIEIICKIHGSFLQNPWSHIKGSGCPKCAFSGRSNPSDKKNWYIYR